MKINMVQLLKEIFKNKKKYIFKNPYGEGGASKKIVKIPKINT